MSIPYGHTLNATGYLSVIDQQPRICISAFPKHAVHYNMRVIISPRCCDFLVTIIVFIMNISGINYVEHQHKLDPIPNEFLNYHYHKYHQSNGAMGK